MKRFFGLLAVLAALGGSLLAQCDKSIWDHVYRPERLVIVEPCVSVFGWIQDSSAGKSSDGVQHESSGDAYSWLKLENTQEHYLTDGNAAFENNNLVYKIVCKFPASDPDGKKACSSYVNPIALVPIGSHVKITGIYVHDSEHKMRGEILVTRIEAWQ